MDTPKPNVSAPKPNVPAPKPKPGEERAAARKRDREVLDKAAERLKHHLSTSLSMADTQPYSDYQHEPALAEAIIAHAKARHKGKQPPALQEPEESLVWPEQRPAPKRTAVVPARKKQAQPHRLQQRHDPDRDLAPLGGEKDGIDPEVLQVQLEHLEDHVRRLEQAVYDMKGAAREIANGQLVHFKITRGMLEGPKFGCMSGLVAGSIMILGMAVGMALLAFIYLQYIMR